MLWHPHVLMDLCCKVTGLFGILASVRKLIRDVIHAYLIGQSHSYGGFSVLLGRY